MIRIYPTVFFMSALLFCTPSFAQNNNAAPVKEARFFSSMQDVPLLGGLDELRDQTVTYDKPEGRIVESVAEIETGNSGAVKKEYEETLPQLGWTRVAENSYAREKESLTLNFESYDGRNFVRVLVRPLGAIPN